jgi:hypothetical protein
MRERFKNLKNSGTNILTEKLENQILWPKICGEKEGSFFQRLEVR